MLEQTSFLKPPQVSGLSTFPTFLLIQRKCWNKPAFSSLPRSLAFQHFQHFFSYRENVGTNQLSQASPGLWPFNISNIYSCAEKMLEQTSLIKPPQVSGPSTFPTFLLIQRKCWNKPAFSSLPRSLALQHFQHFFSYRENVGTNKIKTYFFFYL